MYLTLPMGVGQRKRPKKNLNKLRAIERILGPPALLYAAKMKQGLFNNTRPVYNYSMKGVITCFTGIRKKDELTKLVKLIHSMGGGIRKDMNSKVTHLISNVSGGEKYQYAKTFRLTVLRSQWVHDAWEKRDEPQFLATAEEFAKHHKLKVFEGQKICFFGFPPEEHEHMLDVLRINGGTAVELDDPDCTHVVMANTGGYFPNKLSPSLKSNSSSPNSINSLNHNEIDTELIAQQADDSVETNELEEVVIPHTPKNLQKPDGVVLTFDENNPFQEPTTISPILNSTMQVTDALHSIVENNISTTNANHINLSPVNEKMDIDDSYLEEDICATPLHLPDICKELKRKRGSLDSTSVLSVDSFALPTSAPCPKKPKLSRTGSISKNIKRSMNFVATRTPIRRILRPRRSSVDPDVSICSITSLESTFNESIKKPVKEKLRGLRDRFTTKKSSNSSSPTSHTNIKKTLSGSVAKYKLEQQTPEKYVNSNSIYCTSTSVDIPTDAVAVALASDTIEFKTPKAPKSLTNFNYSTNLPIFCDPNPPEKDTECGLGARTNDSIDSNCLITCNSIIEPDTNPHSSQEPLTSPSSVNVNQTPVSNSCTLDRLLSTATTATASSAARNQNECDISTLCEIDRDLLMVVDEHFTQAKPEPKNSRTHILKSDWFWYTIQNGYADEMDYSFRDYLDSIANTPSSDRRESLPISFNKRKRKRFSQRIQLEGTPLGSGKRRSSVSDAGLLSVSGSFFDSTASPDKLENTTKILAEPEPIVESTPKKKSARFNHFMDFFITESNFVGILDTIVHLFKNPLEERAETSDALLNKSEIKAIFGNLTPIYDIHQRMLEKLSEIHTKWREDALIGEIILQHRDELTKTYPPFVNFFEQMQECLTQCDAHNPRFHAFLKINQAKPECGRENLQDLMIRPVQRLPHISLLLKGILKNTNKNNPDHQKLEEALKAIKEVMTHINENKRKTEEQMVIFDIFNEIDGCPADLISSSRSFISKCEVTELSDNLSGRGDTLSLYLFSDTIVVCKKRSRAFNTAKSPGTAKSSKHIKLISLNAIRFVIDITDSPRAFAMICRQDKDKLYSFSVADDVDKAVYLKTLCKQMAQNACRTDTDKALLYRTSQELEIDISDVNLSTLSKAFKLAARTRLKVGRAFSFSKTPSKLKRAVSTMMTSPFGSTNTLTPASQLAQMRLASCTNINEVAGEVSSRSESPTSQSEVLVAPMSLQPSRKAKSSTLAALRRL